MNPQTRLYRAHQMTIPLNQEVVDDAIIIHNPRTDEYYHSSKQGRLPLTEKGGEYYYQDGSPLRALRKYIVRINPDHLP